MPLVSAPRPSHMTRFARPSGQLAAVTPLRSVSRYSPRTVGWKTAQRFPPCLRWVSARVSVYDAALSSARPKGCALHGASLFFARAKKSKQKKARPCIRPCAARRVRSLHRCSRGRLTRAIPGPLSLSPHPCGSTPYAAIPLTLLKGNQVRPDRPCKEKAKPSPLLDLPDDSNPDPVRRVV